MLPNGRKTLGMRHATDEGTLAVELQRDDLLLLRAWRMPVGLRKGGAAKFPLKDEAEMNDQLHTLVGRGVPLVEALEVASSVVSEASRTKLDRMREAVASGTSFADACDQAGGFDYVTVSVYRAAERTGDLAGAAARLASAARRRLHIAGKALTVMIYPAVVSGISAVLFFSLLVFLVPTIAGQVSQMGGDIPWFSDLVFKAGSTLRDNLIWTVVGIALIAVLCVLLWRFVLRVLVVIASKLKPIAALMLTIEMTRFFSVMAAMTKSGVPLAEALAAGTGVISDAKLRDQLERMQTQLVEGGVFRQLVEQADALPLATRKLLVAGERAGDLDSVFDSLAGDMAAEVDKQSDRLLALLEPLVIVLMFALLGPLILAVAIPMMTFRGDIGN